MILTNPQVPVITGDLPTTLLIGNPRILLKNLWNCHWSAMRKIPHLLCFENQNHTCPSHLSRCLFHSTTVCLGKKSILPWDLRILWNLMKQILPCLILGLFIWTSYSFYPQPYWTVKSLVTGDDAYFPAMPCGALHWIFEGLNWTELHKGRKLVWPMQSQNHFLVKLDSLHLS